jgi:AraC family transcriptional regulator of adaptative response / DNA-3-methyladenine glycosylase II
VFFVGVATTRIYCRPICRRGRRRRSTAASSARRRRPSTAGFRPCLRCRPELAPGSAPVDDAQRVAQLIVQRLEEGHLDGSAGLEEIADQFELSSRQIRRIVQKELGVPPIQLLLTRRLLLAKQLLTETTLPITEVAFASGFSSLRRFNDAFTRRYGMAPTRLRAKRRRTRPPSPRGDVHAAARVSAAVRLARHPRVPLGRAPRRHRARDRDAYARTVQLGKAKGWIRVTQSRKKHALVPRVPAHVDPGAAGALSRVRALFDLNARPDLIAKHLSRDPVLAAAVKANPGGECPGAFNGFEMGKRGDSRAAGHGEGGHHHRVPVRRGVRRARGHAVRGAESPHAGAVARGGGQRGRDRPHGILAARSRSIIALAQAQGTGVLSLDGGTHHNPDDSIRRLAELPGIGQWTAHYIAMRALRWPDAFPKEDIAVRKRLGGVTAKEAEALSQAWRPWRSYAVMHVWGMSS